MYKYTHAWLAFMAVKRLEENGIPDGYQTCAGNLIGWFKSHKDYVPQGAWYPDEVIQDKANSHVLKITPSANADNQFKRLPRSYLNRKHTKDSQLKQISFIVDKHDNLPDRCESIAQSVIDHLKIQESEEKGSPVSPTDNQIALLLFMLSHYISDAHMPFHCDSRRFSSGENIHGHIEEMWEDMIAQHYRIDKENDRFIYDPNGYPLREECNDDEYQSSYLRTVDEVLHNREFIISYGVGNNNIWDFMSAICQYSYLLSYYIIPEGYNHTNVTRDGWQALSSLSFDQISIAVLADAIDSIARVWLMIWDKYLDWVA